VIAEGVETNKQLEFLSAEACTAVQGYLVGKPLPIGAYAGSVGREAAHDGIASVA
jgi:EAL domain-containing protein (putative c-di-GMP-specific phosphodiesterase class I)